MVNFQVSKTKVQSLGRAAYILAVGEVRTLHLYEGYCKVRVLMGTAFVTYCGMPVTLERGQEMTFLSGQKVAMIAAVGRMPVSYELLK